MHRIISFSIRQRWLVLLATLGVAGLGLYSFGRLPIDAVPDITNVQVQINTPVQALSPLEVEKRITFPIEWAMGGIPGVQQVRSLSRYGLSQVTVIFEDGTDIYWARSRTLEYLSNILPRLPQGVNVELARDETAIGWVFEYALVDRTGQNNLAQLRSFQDWHLRYALQSVATGTCRPARRHTSGRDNYRGRTRRRPEPSLAR